MTTISPRTERQLEIAAARLAAAETSGEGRKILAALYALLVVGARAGLDCPHVCLSGRSMFALHAELAPQLRYGFQPDPEDLVSAQLGYYGEAFALMHTGRMVMVVNADAAEA